MYYNGIGVQKDVGLAVTWYRKASVAGDNVAQYSLAMILREEGKKNQAEVAQLLDASARQGNPQAAYEAAKIFEGGIGVRPDYEAAKQFYAEAMTAGYTDAAQGLRRMQIKLGEIKPKYVIATGAPLCPNLNGLYGIAGVSRSPYLVQMVAARMGCVIQSQRGEIASNVTMQSIGQRFVAINVDGTILYTFAEAIHEEEASSQGSEWQGK